MLLRRLGDRKRGAKERVGVAEGRRGLSPDATALPGLGAPGFTASAVQGLSDLGRAPRGALGPLSVYPRWPVPDMLGMAAFKLGDPVTMLVDVEADNSAMHDDGGPFTS